MKSYPSTLDFRLLFFGATLALMAPLAKAATLASYNFSTNLSPTTEDALVTSSALGGAGTSRSSSSYAFQYTGGSNSGVMEFTLTADEGYLMDLSQVNFAYYFPQTAGVNVNVTATFALQYSLDGFATAGIALTSPQANYTSTSGENDSSIGAGDFSAASYSLTSISDAKSITFRIMLSNAASLSSNNYRYAVDDIVVSGDMIVAAVPEPSAFAALAGAGMLGFAVWRRRPARG